MSNILISLKRFLNSALWVIITPEVCLRLHLDKTSTNYYLNRSYPVHLLESKNGILKLRTSYSSETSTALFPYHGYNKQSQNMNLPSQLGYLPRKISATINTFLMKCFGSDSFN